MATPPQKLTRFTSPTSLAHRLILSTLTGRPLHISSIRPSSPTSPGLAPHEISFLRLLESVTNGSHIEISYTGTTLVYRPGLITGSAPGTGATTGGVLRHEIAATNTRGISYFLIPLCLLAPFSTAPVNVLFTGPGVITAATEAGDVSADTVRTAILPLYAQFGISNELEVRILRRSNAGPGGRGGGGEVQLVFGHQVRLPKTVHAMSAGRVKKVRGVAYCTGVSASNNGRMIEGARGVLGGLVPDLYVFSDVGSAPFVEGEGEGRGAAGGGGEKKRIGVGFGLSLVAESSARCLYSADVASPPDGGVTPEEVGRRCAFQLLEGIGRGGCVDLTALPTVLTLMAMGSEDVGRVVLGRDVIGSEVAIGLARDLRALGASGWGIRDADNGSEGDVVVSIVGRGVGNVGRKIA